MCLLLNEAYLRRPGIPQELEGEEIQTDSLSCALTGMPSARSTRIILLRGREIFRGGSPKNGPIHCTDHPVYRRETHK